MCVGFNIITRIADALDFTVPPPKAFIRSSKFLLIFGYDILSGLHFGKISNWGRDRVRDDHVGHDETLIGEAAADAYSGKLKRLEETVLCGPGALDPLVRKIASVAGELPGVPGSYVKKVWERAHEITSEDINALRQILVRLESALSALCHKHSPLSADIVAKENYACLTKRNYRVDSLMRATPVTGEVEPNSGYDDKRMLPPPASSSTYL